MNLARPPARGHAQVRTARSPVVRVLLRRSLLTVAVLTLGLLTLGPGLLGPGLLGPSLQPTSFGPSPAVAAPLTTVDDPTLILFHGEGCPHCASERAWLEELALAYPQLRIEQY